MERLVLARAGRDAAAFFAARRPARVIAAFARSFYVRDADGRIACIGGPGLGDGPLNALAAAAPAIPAAGTAFDPGAADLARLVHWRPPPPGPFETRGLRARLAAIAAARPRGLAVLIPALLGADAGPPADPFVAAALGPLAALRDWRDGRPPETLAGLLGLGPGLTPAGDDALGGAAIALRLRGDTARAEALAAFVATHAPGATSDIAAAHLAAACRGEGAAALHEALGALARGASPDLAAIDAIGHSSGWDALAGAVAVLAQT